MNEWKELLAACHRASTILGFLIAHVMDVKFSAVTGFEAAASIPLLINVGAHHGTAHRAGQFDRRAAAHGDHRANCHGSHQHGGGHVGDGAGDLGQEGDGRAQNTSMMSTHAVGIKVMPATTDRFSGLASRYPFLTQRWRPRRARTAVGARAARNAAATF